MVHLLAMSASALAGSGVPFQAAAGASLIFQGKVVDVSQCISPDGTRPWTFVQFDVSHTLAGTAVPYSGEPNGKFTVRVPAGDRATSRSAVVGLPTFSVGDEFIVPVHAYSGTPGFLPFFIHGSGSYYRVFHDSEGGAVMTGEGRLLQAGSNGQPLLGVYVPQGRSVEPGPPLASMKTLVGDAVDEYRGTVGYDGTTPPQGDWVGRMRIQSSEPVETTEWGTFETEGDCNAQLTGTYDGSTLQLTGWCNAPKAGRVDVIVQGSRNANGKWVGIMRLSASFDPTIAGLFTWHDQPWSSSLDHPDAFTAHTTNFTVAPSVDSPYEDDFTLGEDPERNVDFMAAWAGRRKPMTVTDFRQWLASEAAVVGAGRPVLSLQNNVENCISVQAEAM